MNPSDAPLWHRIAAHQIGQPDAALSFAARLARENRWSVDYAARVFEEYRRFCWLACTCGHEVTPSDQVDQVWHLHLTYSRDYWQVFCPQVLRRDLHHGPTAGGASEGARFYEQYALTLRAYQAAFGPPPPDIWSPAALRFGLHTRALRVYPDEVFLRKDWRAMGVAALSMLVCLVAGMLIGGAW